MFASFFDELEKIAIARSDIIMKHLQARSKRLGGPTPRKYLERWLEVAGAEELPAWATFVRPRREFSKPRLSHRGVPLGEI